jgi:hypothetical protein
MKRTDKDTLRDISDAPDLQRLVQDKRSTKRATSAKGTRRNRRYENRILKQNLMTQVMRSTRSTYNDNYLTLFVKHLR